MPKRRKTPQRAEKRDKETQAIYARARELFTAADLQSFTEIEEGIPAAQVLAKLQAIHERVTRQRTKVAARATPGGPRSLVKQSRVDDMPKRKNQARRPKRDNETQALYDRARTLFTAADLQKFTELDEGIPVEQVLAEMAAIQNRSTRKRKRA